MAGPSRSAAPPNFMTRMSAEDTRASGPAASPRLESAAMLRRLFLSSIFSLALAAAASASQEPRAAGERPNVVFIVWNDPVLERIGFLDDEPPGEGATPRLDALFDQGTRFPRGVQVSSRGLPTAVALLTGRLPHESRVYYDAVLGEVAAAGTLPQLLRGRGYATLCVGRSPLGAPADTGFAREVRSVIPSRNGAVARFVQDFGGKQPLLVWWAPDVPVGHGATSLDEALGELLDALEACGQRANTLFAFATNGEPAGLEFSAGECGAARMRNPIALAWSGRIPVAVRSERATPLDLVPTLLDELDLAIPETVDGRSLRPLLEGGQWEERAVGAAFFPPQPTLGTGTRVPREPGRDLQALALLDGRWKYVLYLHDVGVVIDKRTELVEIERSAGDQSLFDLEADPREQHDLAASDEHAERTSALRARALAWWRTGDGPSFPMPFLPPKLGPPPGEPRPNIVLVLADDMDYEHLGFMGNARVKTPTLDELARTGVVFPVAHVPMSRCRPSLAALLSGRWPHQTGIHDNEARRTLSRRDSLPNLLKAAGYATFLGGKFWEGSQLSMGFLEPRASDTVFKSFVRENQTELFAFIDRYRAERPFFVWWAPMLPHGPFEPPARYRAPFRDAEVPVPDGLVGDARAFQQTERTAYAMDAWFDAGLAELRAKLEETGELADTLFVFLIDNGYANGFPSKGTVFEKGLRTPVVFSWPEGIGGARTRTELVSSLDVYRTILDYAAVPTPAGAAGVSLRPALEGRELATRDVLFGAVYNHEERPGPQRAEDGVYALYARTERWKFVLYLRRVDPEHYVLYHEFAPFPARARGDRDLFDLELDPYERNDLSGDAGHAALMQELQQGCLAWWRETGGAELELPGAPGDNPGDKKKKRKE
jgi:uncharacterized sulfatase